MPYTFLDVVLLLPNQIWVYLPTCSRVTLLTVGGGEEKGSIIAGCQARTPVVLVLKIPDLPEGLQGKVFKDRVREGGCGAHDPLMVIFFSLVDGEVTRSQHHQPLVLRNRGPHACGQCSWLLPPGGGFRVYKTVQGTWLRMLSISLEEELKVLDCV